MKKLSVCLVLGAIAECCVLTAQTRSGSAVVRLNPTLDEIIAPDAKAELLKGDYFGFLEGPVWVQEGGTGYLLFSDTAANAIYKWTPDGQISVFLPTAGFTGWPSNLVDFGTE